MPVATARLRVAEFDATLRSSMRRFHTLSMGKIGQLDAPGTVGGLTSPLRYSRVRSPVPGVAADAGPTMADPATTKTTSVNGQRRWGRRRGGVGMAGACRACGPS